MWKMNLVDKSGARKQHSVGLRTALVSKTLVIHNAKMDIKSDKDAGYYDTETDMPYNESDKGKDKPDIESYDKTVYYYLDNR